MHVRMGTFTHSLNDPLVTVYVTSRIFSPLYVCFYFLATCVTLFLLLGLSSSAPFSLDVLWPW